MRPFFLLSGLSNEGLGNIFFTSLVRLSCAFATLPYLIVLEEKLIYLFNTDWTLNGLNYFSFLGFIIL